MQGHTKIVTSIRVTEVTDEMSFGHQYRQIVKTSGVSQLDKVAFT